MGNKVAGVFSCGQRDLCHLSKAHGVESQNRDFIYGGTHFFFPVLHFAPGDLLGDFFPQGVPHTVPAPRPRTRAARGVHA